MNVNPLHYTPPRWEPFQRQSTFFGRIAEWIISQDHKRPITKALVYTAIFWSVIFLIYTEVGILLLLPIYTQYIIRRTDQERAIYDQDRFKAWSNYARQAHLLGRYKPFDHLREVQLSEATRREIILAKDIPAERARQLNDKDFLLIAADNDDYFRRYGLRIVDPRCADAYNRDNYARQ